MSAGRLGDAAYVLSNEIAANRRPLLRLSFVFRYPQSLEFQRGTHQRNFRFYKNVTADGETLATRAGRSFLGPRHAPTPCRTATCLQRNAQGNAPANDTSAGLYPKANSPARLQE